MSNFPRMKTIQQLVNETGISYYAIRNLCLENKIVFIKSGRKYLINAEKFEAYLNGEPVSDRKAEEIEEDEEE